MYLSKYYPTNKRGFFGKLFTVEVDRSEVIKLLDSSKDQKLIETIRYIYNINESIIITDLILIKNEINKFEKNHHDQVIKGGPIDLSKEEFQTIQDSKKLIDVLLDKYKTRNRSTRNDDQKDLKN